MKVAVLAVPEVPIPRVTAGYHDRPRPELVELLATQTLGGRVLDLGCAAGWLGAELLSRNIATHVVGVERDAIVAARARQRLHTVLTSDLEAPDLADKVQGPFDVLVAADILEHLVTPAPVLAAMVEKIVRGGYAVISIPNVRHFRIVVDLVVKNEWRYVEEGVCDHTHLRFFTSKGMQRLLADAGLTVVSVQAPLRRRAALVSRLCPPLTTFLAAQIAFVARRL